MRYYDIKITKPDGSLYTFKSCGNAFNGSTLSSLLPTGPQTPQAGLTNPAALTVEWDLPIANFTDPGGQAFLRVWGLGVADLGSASDLNGLDVQVSGGMAKGLPLANPNQAGLLLKGTILQAFGNWQGTSQTLDLIFGAGRNSTGPSSGFSGTGADIAGNFPFSCPAGTPLARAIANTLSVAMPNLPVSISISPDLVQNYDQVGHYGSLYQFASFIQALSIGIIGGTDYNGVQIASDGQTITVWDGLGPPSIDGPKAVKAILYQDMIGQPSWLEAGVISFKTVKRADIHISDTISLPQTLVTQASASNGNFGANPQKGLTFAGDFTIRDVHHYGNSRQPDASSWATVFQAYFAS